MYRNEMCVGLSAGRSTPRIRGICRYSLTLALLVARVGADDQELAVPLDQLAVLADPLDRRSHFHGRNSLSSKDFAGNSHSSGPGGVDKGKKTGPEDHDLECGAMT